MPDRNAIPRTAEPEAKPSLKLRIEEKLGLLDPVQIQVFRSFGIPDLLQIRGRVVERKSTAGTTEKSSLWRNIVDTVHRLESNEIPGARLRARFGGKSWETTSDEEGYFVFSIDPEEPLEPGWHEVEVELVESVGKPAERRVRGRVLVPSPDAEFAVVSDLDDTVIESKSTELLQEIAILFGDGARERIVFPGIPAFYRALSQGPDDGGQNPIFYVSKSGWNLNDLFEEFMEINDIPIGPVFLDDLCLVEKRSALMGSSEHKFSTIDLLVRTYPELPFLLIGDSGKHDPETYLDIVEKHPGRVKAIYIRDVSPPERDQEVRAIAKRLEKLGVPMLRVKDTLQAAEHAAGQGYISRESLEEVRREVERQQGDAASGQR
jgi:phosphatidate phosphatase APP1